MPATKYKQLQRHNSVCNDIFYKLQDCEAEHPFAKFVGYCTDFNTQLAKCINANRQQMLKRNEEQANAKKRRLMEKKKLTVLETDS